MLIQLVCNDYAMTWLARWAAIVSFFPAKEDTLISLLLVYFGKV